MRKIQSTQQGKVPKIRRQCTFQSRIKEVDGNDSSDGVMSAGNTVPGAYVMGVLCRPIGQQSMWIECDGFSLRQESLHVPFLVLAQLHALVEKKMTRVEWKRGESTTRILIAMDRCGCSLHDHKALKHHEYDKKYSSMSHLKHHKNTNSVSCVLGYGGEGIYIDTTALIKSSVWTVGTGIARR